MSGKGASKKISWADIKKHGSFDDCWIVIHGKVYDVTKWAAKHPGGDIILLGGGRDCTVHYECYHPKGVDQALMQKYYIGEVDVASPGGEPAVYDWSSPFYSTMKDRVIKALAENGVVVRRGPTSMFVKSALILAGWLLSWYFGMVKGWLLAAAMFGFFSSQVGVSIMHDGSHGAYSTKPLINKIAAFGMELIGASTITWEFQHVMGHHPYTNLGTDKSHVADENDPDVFSSYPLIVMHPIDAKAHRPWYTHYQHIYAPFLFAFFTMAKVMKDDFKCFFSDRVSHIPMTARTSDPTIRTRFYVTKAASLFYMLVLPCLLHGLVKGLLIYAVAHMVCGEFLALMFIVTHVTEGASMLDGRNSVPALKQQDENVRQARKELGIREAKATPPAHDWAALQCRTSVNWATDSFLWTHTSGGLNHQIEHHLFPGICHMHYPLIRNAVKTTCAEYGVPYIEHPTLGSAIGGMLAYLRDVGQGRLKAA